MICFDMDGVLVRYDRKAYTQIDPEYRKPGYYKNLTADTKALQLFTKMLHSCPDSIFIITSVPAGIIHNSVILDKLSWIDNNIPEFDFGTHFIAPTGNKMSIIEWIRGSQLTKDDILIDDYNPNLCSWAARGGTAIKYLNGINNPDSWPGYVLDARDETADEMFSNLMSIVIGD